MINNFKESAISNQKLEENETIEKIIKVRSLSGVKTISASSFVGGTITKSNDYALFDNLCFTNKRLIIDRVNYSDNVLITKDFKREDIKEFFFTNKIVKVKTSKNGTQKIKTRHSYLDIFALLYSIFALLLGIFTINLSEPPTEIILVGLFTLIYLIARIPYLKHGETIQIIMKNNEKYDFLIAESDYISAKNYFKDLKLK